MESNRIDDIFKRKLERHSLPVSESAWSQVQSQFAPKKKKKPIVWMFAASISLLILLSVGIVYNMEEENTNSAVALIELNAKQALLNEKQIPLKPQIKVGKSTDQESVDPNMIPANKGQQSKIMFAAKEPVQDETVPVMPLQRINNLEAAVALNEEIVKPNITGANQKKEEKTSGIKVEMYYNQQELAVVKPENSTNIFNKKANQLKSLASEYSLADLRSAKNELFASAFQNSRKELNN